MTLAEKIIPRVAYCGPNSAAALRLFCFPYGGGGSLSCRDWSRTLPAKVEVCPVQLQGRGSRMHEKPFTRMEPLVKAVLREIGSYLDKPFAFFGHSMGAVISFEVARLLRREGTALPVHLFVSGRSAPQLSEPKPPTFSLPDAEFIEELLRLRGTPPEVLNHPVLMQVLLPPLHPDLVLSQT